MTTVIDEAAPTATRETQTEASAPSLFLHPPQGQWTIADWAALPDDAPRCELVEGCLEVLPMPRRRHHWIQRFLGRLLTEHLGWECVDLTGPRIATEEGSGRIPDIYVLLSPPKLSEPNADLFDRPNMIVEVVSPGSRQRDRDYVEKQREYAVIGVSEYWIVDPEEEVIVVFGLNEREAGYEELGRYGRGSSAVSRILDDFSVDVATLFDECPAG